MCNCVKQLYLVSSWEMEEESGYGIQDSLEQFISEIITLVTSVCTGCNARIQHIFGKLCENLLTNNLKCRACCIHPFTMLHYINCFGTITK